MDKGHRVFKRCVPGYVAALPYGFVILCNGLLEAIPELLLLHARLGLRSRPAEIVSLLRFLLHRTLHLWEKKRARSRVTVGMSTRPLRSIGLFPTKGSMARALKVQIVGHRCRVNEMQAEGLIFHTIRARRVM